MLIDNLAATGTSLSDKEFVTYLLNGLVQSNESLSSPSLLELILLTLKNSIIYFSYMKVESIIVQETQIWPPHLNPLPTLALLILEIKKD